MQASPISAIANGVPVVLGGGKMGVVYEMNAATARCSGRRQWNPQRPRRRFAQGPRAPEHAQAALQFRSRSARWDPDQHGAGRNTVYVVTINFPFRFKNDGQVDGLNVNDKVAGDVEALNLLTGKVEWSTAVDDLPLGAATVSNNLVFTTLVKVR